MLQWAAEKTTQSIPKRPVSLVNCTAPSIRQTCPMVPALSLGVRRSRGTRVSFMKRSVTSTLGRRWGKEGQGMNYCSRPSAPQVSQHELSAPLNSEGTTSQIFSPSAFNISREFQPRGRWPSSQTLPEGVLASSHQT